jgi:hypothetical protein
MASEAARQKYPDDYETEPGEVIWNLAEVLREAYDAGRVDALREGAETIRAWRAQIGSSGSRRDDETWDNGNISAEAVIRAEADRIEKEARG